MQGQSARLNAPAVNNNRPPEYKLQVNDILAVNVTSSNAEIAKEFNQQGQNNMRNINPAALYVSGYSIGPAGNITLPTIGAVEVVGLTVDEARAAIQQKVDEYLTSGTVLVALVSFKISVLGEVRNPGYYYVYNDQVTIFEALSMASDVANLGDRKHVNLVRQVPGGNESVFLDLTKADLLTSKYYYLQPNDMLYVPPLRAKSNDFNISNFGIVTSVVSVISTTLSVLVLTGVITRPE
ncbi:polysaccharide biosynthesis/export family protein [Catalinimonas alkaloidigena]|uniref:polysaccharide biosynthesis/export family protein n=1 Tax=Catalinimonas alkaloidigena TaxID=1075417 RepID=UPI00159FA0AB|nr:polysaccharide biosynthesis/export family protein [Catalinimonas alkaloidigena]